MGWATPTLKIRGRKKLDSIMRDIHAGYSRKHLLAKEDSSLEQLKRDSSVSVTYKKFMGKKHGYYRYYYYRAYTQMKPDTKVAVGHPAWMQRKHTGGRV